MHALPGISSVDIDIADDITIENLDYKEVSGYFPIGPGNNQVQVYPAGEREQPIISTEVNLPPSEAITLAITGTQSAVDVLPIIQYYQTIDPQESRIRFTHLAPGAPAFDIILLDGNIGFFDVGYTQTTDYISITPGTYSLEVRPAGEEEVILTAENLVFAAGKAYTIYAVGLIEGNPALEIISLEEALPVVEEEQNPVNETEEIQQPEIVVPTRKAIKIKFTYG